MPDLDHISPKVRIALEIIRNLKESRKLLNFYDNAKKNDEIKDCEREILIETIETRLREIAPAAATRKLGPKDSDARTYLTRVYRKVSDLYDLSGNRVKNGVKTGGDMITGRKFVDVYISFKNGEGWNAGLQWIQESPATERYLQVYLHQTGPGSVEGQTRKRFEVGEEDAAEAEYIDQVSRLVRSL